MEKKWARATTKSINLTELFSGNHPLLTQPFGPMTIRFFILQTHYRSTLDFSSEALVAAEKGLKRLWEGYEILKKLEAGNHGLPADKEPDEKLIHSWMSLIRL